MCVPPPRDFSFILTLLTRPATVIIGAVACGHSGPGYRCSLSRAILVLGFTSPSRKYCPSRGYDPPKRWADCMRTCRLTACPRRLVRPRTSALLNPKGGHRYRVSLRNTQAGAAQWRVRATHRNRYKGDCTEAIVFNVPYPGPGGFLGRGESGGMLSQSRLHLHLQL